MASLFSSSPLHVNAVVVAAGQGERMGSPLPKPFLPLAGVPLVIHTVRSLTRSTRIARVILVVAAERETLCRAMVEAHGPFSIPVRLVHGGLERQDSVRLGLAALDAACEVVVIHDAARPFITPEIIDQSIIVAAEVGGALVAVQVRDTIKRVEQDGMVRETLSRQNLWLAQTPQTFRTSVIREAHDRALAAGVKVTDDAALVEWAGGQVKIVPGDPLNFKITTPGDLHLAEAILKEGLGAGKTDLSSHP